MSEVTVSARGARRWAAGHPWIYRSDVAREPSGSAGVAGVVSVRDAKGRCAGRALYSPGSEIRLRMLTRDDAPLDRTWWRERIAEAAARRASIPATAYRVVHAEADGLPSLIVDRYGPYLSAQLLSAGLEACRGDVIGALEEALEPRGILLRNDAPIRRHEDLPLSIELAAGEVPDEVEVEEQGVRYRAALRTGQKTGAYLDQRENRALAGSLARGRALDVFTYHGSFALHLARRADTVLAVDQSPEALARGRVNAALNGLSNIEWLEANAFDLLRELERKGERFDVIVLDPPAFARTKDSVERALGGYKEINLRALRLLAPGGRLLTFSCSYHVGRWLFLQMLEEAAADSGRVVQLERLLGQPADHPEILTIPETGYLKGATFLCQG
jgi:23S rRNA (cytosine1962-C5)-methyltransferase